ncbi:MAG: BlaI/MecI/CopY family transcriptional regulator [Candidatus Bathyarchaeia archaeon]
MLGKTAKKIVGVLQKREKATVREVFEDLTAAGVNIAYTTVFTILERLHAKGFVDRVNESYRGAERFVYVYKDIESRYIDDMLNSLVTIFGKGGVVHLAERLEELSEEDLKRLKERLKI